MPPLCICQTWTLPDPGEPLAWNVSNLDTNSEAEPEQSESSQLEQNSSSQASTAAQAGPNSSQAASQPPVEQKPAETSKPEKEEDVSNLDTT